MLEARQPLSCSKDIQYATLCDFKSLLKAVFNAESNSERLRQKVFHCSGFNLCDAFSALD